MLLRQSFRARLLLAGVILALFTAILGAGRTARADDPAALGWSGDGPNPGLEWEARPGTICIDDPVWE